MQQQVKYNGIAFRPDDSNSTDGELTTSVNLVNESGALTPIEKPKVIMTLEAGDKLLYIHRGSGYTNHIIYSKSESTISYIGSGLSPDEKQQIFKVSYTPEQLNDVHITALGNTLIIVDYSGVNYALCKGAKQTYTFLGAKPPVPALQFGLNGEFCTSDKVEVIHGHIGSDIVPPDAKRLSFSLKDVSVGEQEYVNWIIGIFTDGVIPNVNKFIQEEATDKNRFMFPFLVRYAYRLYDGTYMMHSHPVLMIPVKGCNPSFFMDRFSCHADGSNGDKPQTQLEIVGYVSALLCNLDYTFCNYWQNGMVNGIQDINNWKDIIKSVDVFVTAPIWTYDQNGKVYGWHRIVDGRTPDGSTPDAMTPTLASVAKITNPSAKWKNANPTDNRYLTYANQSYEYQFMCSHDYAKKPIHNPTENAIETVNGFPTPRFLMELPQVKEDEYIKNIQEASIFYRVASIELDELKTVGTTKNLTIKDNILKTLQQQPTLPDDYKSHCLISAECSYVYNARLNLGNITEQLFKGLPLKSQFTRWDGFGDSISNDNEIVRLYVHIKNDGEEFVVSPQSTERVTYSELYFFYPDTRAYQLTLEMYDTAMVLKGRYTIPLTEHPLLNGAYYFKGFRPLFEGASAVPTVSTDNKVRHPSKIYTSEVNNPFVFQPSRINSVGNGDVSALSSATNAISEGQFGQFPLYAFTSEGVWAMEVNSTGGYSSRQPISRDVLRGKRVLQLDQAIAFPSEKGVMIIRGGASQCITTVLEGTFSASNILRFNDIIGNFGLEEHTCNYNFMAFIKESILAYDYINSRIYISNPQYNYSYVYSTKTSLWSIINCSFSNALNSYPEAIVTQQGSIQETVYSLNSDEFIKLGMIITRPIKLGSPTVLKTISALVTRGNIANRKHAVMTVLLGSIDGIKFIPFASSESEEIRNIHGSAYKYFRVMQAFALNSEESITGIEVLFEPKRTNKLR